MGWVCWGGLGPASRPGLDVKGVVMRVVKGMVKGMVKVENRV